MAGPGTCGIYNAGTVGKKEDYLTLDKEAGVETTLDHAAVARIPSPFIIFRQAQLCRKSANGAAFFVIGLERGECHGGRGRRVLGCPDNVARTINPFPFQRSLPDRSEIQRALGLFDSPARYTMGVDHRCPDIGMAQQCLNSADIVIGLQKMGRETVAKSV